MSERNIVDDDDKKSLKINNKISTHSFTAVCRSGSFSATPCFGSHSIWLEHFGERQTVRNWKKRICLVHFIFFLLLSLSLQSTIVVGGVAVAVANSLNEILKSHKRTVQSVWEPVKASAVVNNNNNNNNTENTCQISDITVVRTDDVEPCICFVIITSFTRYYLFGWDLLFL